MARRPHRKSGSACLCVVWIRIKRDTTSPRILFVLLASLLHDQCHSMMVYLLSDMYERIITETVTSTEGPDDASTHLLRQGCLARLMRVSKLFCYMCEATLYHDCLVSDLDKFLHNLEPCSRKEYLLSLVETLRLYLPLDESLGEPTYPDMITTGDWTDLGLNPNHLNHAGVERRLRRDWDYAKKLWARAAAEKLHIAIRGDHATLPEHRAFSGLERVIMSGDGDQTWGDYEDDFTTFADALPAPSPVWEEFGYPRELSTKPIPHLLINLDSVKYYCQSSIGGPFALKADYIQPHHNPEIVTHHTRTQVVGEKIFRIPPVVLGSVNRYIFDLARLVISGGNGDVVDFGEVRPIFIPLIAILNYRPDTLFLYPDSYQFYDFIDEDKVLLGNTTIELYNYCRHSVRENAKISSTGHVDFGESNLKGIQAHVDQIAGRWKGRVTLKNLEDLEPCPACGKQEDIMVIPDTQGRFGLKLPPPSLPPLRSS